MKTDQSAAKPLSDLSYREGSQTIPEGSTPINGGSGESSAHNGGGDDIVDLNKRFKKFIEKSNVKHNNKFNYSGAEYINAKTAITISCPKHGKFTQTPDKHLRSKFGCQECSAELRYKPKTKLKHPKSFDFFLTKANTKYNNKFSYRLIEEWRGLTKTFIEITCPIHGSNNILAVNHLQNNNHYGCVKCANENRALNKTMEYDKVISKCNQIHEDKYDYPKSNNSIYKNTKSIIDIICRKHGLFRKRMVKHLSGQGCFLCGVEELINNGVLVGGYNNNLFNNNPELKKRDAYLYYLDIGNGMFKIGITIVNISDRINGLKAKAKQNGIYIKPKCVSFMRTTLYDAYQLEQKILNEFNYCRKYTEWSTELFGRDIYKLIESRFK